jgi:hypothetical protein
MPPYRTILSNEEPEGLIPMDRSNTRLMIAVDTPIAKSEGFLVH